MTSNAALAMTGAAGATLSTSAGDINVYASAAETCSGAAGCGTVDLSGDEAHSRSACETATDGGGNALGCTYAAGGSVSMESQGKTEIKSVSGDVEIEAEHAKLLVREVLVERVGDERAHRAVEFADER